MMDGFRARNPRFLMHHFGQKTGFRARNAGMNEIKSGIPCDGWVYKTQQIRTMTDWCFLCNNIARMGLQNKHARCSSASPNTASSGDVQLKRNTTCEKRWKKCNNIGFEPKWNISYITGPPGPWLLTAYTWVLKSGLCSTFHLNHF